MQSSAAIERQGGSVYMSRGSAELTNARREEIVSACEKLYQTMSFKDPCRNNSYIMLA